MVGLEGAASITVGYNHSCARRSDASVACWRENWFGQLGNGSFISSSTPMQVALGDP